MNEPLRVWSACTYPSTELGAQRGVFLQDTWHAEKFVKAIKGDDLKKGFAYVPVPIGGPCRRLNNGNKDEACAWFGEMIAKKFRITAPGLLLVPVPPHDGTDSGVVRKSRIWAIAEAVAEQNRACVATVGITWRNPMQSARRGGTRSLTTLLQNCVAADSIRPGASILLVDDVITTGHHLAACATRLRKVGANVLLGICVGRTVTEQESEPFSWIERSVELV